MKSQLLSHAGDIREWVLVMDSGDEVMEELQRFSLQNELASAHFTGIGALSEAIVAWFDLRAKKYRPVRLAEQLEVLSLVGDIVEGEKGPSVHAHICVARRDATAHGGHLVGGMCALPWKSSCPSPPPA